ncbi:metacaspase-2-like [Aphidius gifuensis]|uniref:metacaspase-2-like n=1 Tax=Aphidius gifuensis TaxID=684658 RepID=UPI001CDB70C5|nr:metacaspase-2-like [Aphidius gifuensis]
MSSDKDPFVTDKSTNKYIKLWKIKTIILLLLLIIVTLIIGTVLIVRKHNFDSEKCEYNIKITEGNITNDCITNLNAYYADFNLFNNNKNSHENIKYIITNKIHNSLFHIDENGCMIMKNKLYKYMNNNNKIMTINIIPRDDYYWINMNNYPYKNITVNIELSDANENYKKSNFIINSNNNCIPFREKLFPREIINLDEYNIDKSNLTYRINKLNNSQMIYDKFDIKNNGIIDSRVIFDYHDKNMYNISLLITDNKYMMTDELLLTICIEKNDDKLDFCKDKSTFEISTKQQYEYFINTTTPITKLCLKNNFNQVSFKITSGNDDEQFMITSTGEIYVNDIFSDYKNDMIYELTINAIDEIFNYNIDKKIKIIIKKFNNYSPVFKSHNDTIDIVIDKDIEGCLINVEAYDPDIDDEKINQHVIYGLSEPQYFDIDNNGCVKLIKKIKNTQYNYYPSNKLDIFAFDNDGDGPTSLKTSIQININFIRANYNEVFTLPYKIYYLEDNNSPGFIVNLTANSNNATSVFKQFKFVINLTTKRGKLMSKLFEIRGDNELYSTAKLHSNNRVKPIIPITIISKDDSSINSSVDLTIHVPKNYSEFKFSKDRYVFNIFDDKNINEHFISVYTLPASNEIVKFNIISGNVNDTFKLDYNNIQLNNKLDYNKVKKYQLEIEAVCGADRDTSIVEIFIMKSNDTGLIFHDNLNAQTNLQLTNQNSINNHCLYDLSVDVNDDIGDQIISYSFTNNDYSYFDIDTDKNCLIKSKNFKNTAVDYLHDDDNYLAVSVVAYVDDDWHIERRKEIIINIMPFK